MQKMSRKKSNKQLDEFFLNNPKVYRLCVAIQLCLIAGWEPKNIRNKLFNKLEKEFKHKNKTLLKPLKNMIGWVEKNNPTYNPINDLYFLNSFHIRLQNFRNMNIAFLILKIFHDRNERSPHS